MELADRRIFRVQSEFHPAPLSLNARTLMLVPVWMLLYLKTSTDLSYRVFCMHALVKQYCDV